MSTRYSREQKRRDLVEACNDDIVALLREAHDAGLPLEDAVVLVADPEDGTGARLVAACSQLGEPLEGAHVFVVGVPLALAREILEAVDVDLPERLHPAPPAGTAQLFCLAEGGVLSLFLGLGGDTAPAT